MYAAYVVYWTEFERGWGQRPDGETVHKDKATAEAYIADYWKREKERNAGGGVPDIYSAPGDPRLEEVGLDQWTRAQAEGSFWRKM